MPATVDPLVIKGDSVDNVGENNPEMSIFVDPGKGLTAVKALRRDLREAMAALESAVAGPSFSEGWLDGVEHSLDELRKALEAHIEEVEGPDGLLTETIQSAPRLAAEAETLRKHHGVLLKSLGQVQTLAMSTENDPTHDPDPLRRGVVSLLGRLTLHRQRGADLVFEAYNVDIGAMD
jgi:hypothetical protein